MQAAIENYSASKILSEKSDFLSEVVKGLSLPAKSLPCKYFYNARGSALFEEICELPEYYPTRTESLIMREFVYGMTAELRQGCTIVEYGSGSSTKTRILLDAALQVSSYVPVDISREHLEMTAVSLRASYPKLQILPVCADYTRPFSLPSIAEDQPQTVVYFPGSTIGNFHPDEAKAFLENMLDISGQLGGLLIGVDLRKDRSILHQAYNDSAGKTAQFNLNILHHINEVLGATFQPELFAHLAFFNGDKGRIEMHLVSTQNQEIWVGGSMFKLRTGESIWTESSYKYTLPGFADLAKSAGWLVQKVWTDPNNWFSVQYLTPV